MRRVGFRNIGRIILIAIALAIIVGGVGLWLMNRSLAWTMYGREASLQIDKDVLQIETVVDLKVSRGSFTGILLNPGLQIEEISVDERPLPYWRIASLVVVKTGGQADEQGRLQLTVRTAGEPVNHRNEKRAPILVKQDYWLLTPDALWLPRNGDGEGQLTVEVAADPELTVLLSGQPIRQTIEDGQRISRWLVPSKQPVMLAASLEQLINGQQYVVYADASLTSEKQTKLKESMQQALSRGGSTDEGSVSNIVILDGPIADSWLNLHVVSGSDVTDNLVLIRKLNTGKWEPYFAAGKERNWMADSLVTYLALLEQYEGDKEGLRSYFGKLADQYYLAFEAGMKASFAQMGNVPEAIYQKAGLPRSLFFWRRLHCEMGDAKWEQLLHQIPLQGGGLSSESFSQLVAEVAGQQVASVCQNWLERSPHPNFRLGAHKLVSEGGKSTLQVVVWQRRPLTAGSIVVRAYGPNGEQAEERLWIDVLSNRATLEMDFRPVAIALDPENEWLNSNASWRQQTLGAMHCRKEVKVIFADGDEYSESQRAQAKASAEALVTYLRQQGVAAVGISDQKISWQKLNKLNVAIVQPDQKTHAMVEDSWLPVALANLEQGHLQGIALPHPQTAGLGLWVWRGNLPTTEADWGRLIETEEQVATFDQKMQSIDSWTDPEAWLAPASLYKIIDE